MAAEDPKDAAAVRLALGAVAAAGVVTVPLVWMWLPLPSSPLRALGRLVAAALAGMVLLASGALVFTSAGLLWFTVVSGNAASDFGGPDLPWYDSFVFYPLAAAPVGAISGLVAWLLRLVISAETRADAP
jgi:hypothetical protein